MTERLTYPLISQSAAPYLLTLLKTPANRQVGCLSWKQQFLSSFLKLKKPSSNSDRNYELILSNTPHTQPPHTHTPHMYTYPPPHTHTHTHTQHTHTHTPLKTPECEALLCLQEEAGNLLDRSWFPCQETEAPLGMPGIGYPRAAQTPSSQGATKRLASSTSLLASSIRGQTK